MKNHSGDAFSAWSFLRKQLLHRSKTEKRLIKWQLIRQILQIIFSLPLGRYWDHGGGGGSVDLAGSDVDGDLKGWWESVIRPSSSPSSCGIPLLSGGNEGEQAAFLFLVALVSLAAAGCTWGGCSERCMAAAGWGAAATVQYVPAETKAFTAALACCCCCQLLLLVAADWGCFLCWQEICSNDSVPYAVKVYFNNDYTVL